MLPAAHRTLVFYHYAARFVHISYASSIEQRSTSHVGEVGWDSVIFWWYLDFGGFGVIGGKVNQG